MSIFSSADVAEEFHFVSLSLSRLSGSAGLGELA